jgi:tRNA U54 and U55 pseudouridine synthase Pus10
MPEELRNKHWADRRAAAFYNWTLGKSKREIYQRLAQIQNYKCAICKGSVTGKEDLARDHDHVTLLIRGLLCKNCNLGLGLFKDSVENLDRAIKYLGHAQRKIDSVSHRFNRRMSDDQVVELFELLLFEARASH